MRWPYLALSKYASIVSGPVDDRVKQSSALCILDWPKNALSSETKKFKLETTFSQYLGQNHYRKPNFENFYTFFDPAWAIQKFST